MDLSDTRCSSGSCGATSPLDGSSEAVASLSSRLTHIGFGVRERVQQSQFLIFCGARLPVSALRTETGTEHQLIGGSADHLFPLRDFDQFYVEAERLQLANQYVERLGNAGLDGCLALDDGLINLGAAINIVRLGSQQLLQDECCSISFQRPDFHFSEALSAELRLAAQRLLGDKRVRSDGARVDFVVHQV